MNNNKNRLIWWVEKIFTAIIVIAAVCTTYYAFRAGALSNEMWEVQLKANQPYFNLIEPRITLDPDQLIVGMENFGAHPAKDLQFKVIIVDSDLESTADIEVELDYSSANVIPPHSPFTITKNLTVGSNTSNRYVIIAFSYKDAIVNHHQSQILYAFWDGAAKVPYNEKLHIASLDDSEALRGFDQVVTALDEFL